MLIKYSIQTDLMYWGNFIVSMCVELFYQFSFFAFWGLMFTQTQSIGGWNANEMLILLGVDTFTSEFLTGLIIVWNSREIPYKIWNGELDRILLKPIHPLFTLSLGRPWFPSIVSACTGFFLIVLGFSRAGLTLNFLWLLGALLFFMCGFVIVYCIVIGFSLLSFFSQDTTTLPRIGERIVYSFSSRPHTIYSNWLKFVFFIIFPVVYVSNFSAATLISGINWQMLALAFLTAAIFLFLLSKLWAKAINSYASASS